MKSTFYRIFLLLCAVSVTLTGCMVPDDKIDLDNEAAREIKFLELECVATLPGRLELRASYDNPAGARIASMGFVARHEKEFYSDPEEYVTLPASSTDGNSFTATADLTPGREYSVSAYVMTDGDYVVRSEVQKAVNTRNLTGYVSSIGIRTIQTEDGLRLEADVEGEYEDVFFAVSNYSLSYTTPEHYKVDTKKSGHTYSASIKAEDYSRSGSVHYMLCVKHQEFVYSGNDKSTSIMTIEESASETKPSVQAGFVTADVRYSFNIEPDLISRVDLQYQLSGVSAWTTAGTMSLSDGSYVYQLTDLNMDTYYYVRALVHTKSGKQYYTDSYGFRTARESFSCYSGNGYWNIQETANETDGSYTESVSAKPATMTLMGVKDARFILYPYNGSEADPRAVTVEAHYDAELGSFNGVGTITPSSKTESWYIILKVTSLSGQVFESSRLKLR